MAYPRAWLDRPLGAIFAAQAERHPGALAARSARREVSYGELAAEVNRLARALLAARGPGNEPIALLFEHDVGVLAAILGVLAAGKAYVALDPHFPAPRLAALLGDCRARLIICDAAHRERARELADHTDAAVLDADGLSSRLSAAPVGLEVSPRAPACIAYTSGSAGEPKGVVGDHRSIGHRAMILVETARVGPGDRLSLLESVGVGGSFRGIFGALLTGAATFPFDVRREGVDAIGAWLAREHITVCMAAASVFRQFAAALPDGGHCPALRYLGIGREPVLRSDVELFRSRFGPRCALVNVMGSAETGTICELPIDPTTPLDEIAPPGQVVPVGHAVRDTEVLLLDDGGQPVTPGEVGEIVVRSDFLSVGYWGRPDLDAAVFSPSAPGAAGRVCRTGDLGRRLADGRLIHLGRKDSRAKLRGHFFDAALVEAALLLGDGVRAAVVAMREDRPGDQRLVAYVVPEKGGAVTSTEIQRAARARLDPALVPAAVVILEALPLAPNGKVDRGALPAPPRVRPALLGRPETPRTPVEREIERVWAASLELPEVGVHDDFVELGGTSLVAGRIAALVSQRLGVEIPARALLEASTVSAMAVAVTAHLLAVDLGGTGPAVGGNAGGGG